MLEKTETDYRDIFRQSIITASVGSGPILASTLNDFITGVIMANARPEIFAATSLVRSLKISTIILWAAPLGAIKIRVGFDVRSGKSPNEIARILQASAILSGISCLPAIITFSVAKPLLLAFKQDPLLANLTQDCFWAYLPGVPLTFLRQAGAAFMGGLNKQRWSFLIEMGSTALLASGITYILGLGKFGAASLGLEGYGYALLIDSGVGLTSYLIALRWDPTFKKYPLFKLQGNCVNDLKTLATMGGPFIFALLGEVGLLLTLPIMAGVLGEDHLIAQNIASIYLAILFVPTLSLFNGSTILVARAMGAKHLGNIKRYALAGLTLASILPGGALIFSLASPSQMMKPFINAQDYNSTAPALLKTALPITAVSGFFDAARLILSGVLLGMQDINLPTTLNLVVQLLVGIPIMYALGFHTDLGVSGLILGYGIVSLLLTIFMGGRFYQQHNQIFNHAKSNETGTVDLNEIASTLNQLPAPEKRESEENKSEQNENDAGSGTPRVSRKNSSSFWSEPSALPAPPEKPDADTKNTHIPSKCTLL